MSRVNQSEHYAIDDFTLSQLDPGFKGSVILDAHDTHRGAVQIPALVLVGEQPGPTLMAVAGVHGNEYEGQDAIRRAFAEIDPNRLTGTYFGIPVCNVFAYESRSRCSPPHLDGLNLARVFPGDENGSPTQQLAHALMRLVLQNLGRDDLFIDFHSASDESNYVPLVGFRDIDSEGRKASEEAARHFGECPVWLFGAQRGMFNAEVSRAGIPTLGTETTGQAGCHPADVQTYTNGLLNLLRFKTMLADTTPPQRYDGSVYQGTTVVTQTTGFMRRHRHLRDEVHCGDILADIVSTVGEPLEEVRASCSGQIWMHRTNPAIRAGETVCIIGTPAE